MKKLLVGLIAVSASMLLTSTAFAASTTTRAAKLSIIVTVPYLDYHVLQVHVRELGLVPGQNYAFLSTAPDVVTFQCYRDRTFTPVRGRTTDVSGTAISANNLVANASGVVAGDWWLDYSAVWPDFCPRKQEAVPIGVTYLFVSVVDVVTYGSASIEGPWSLLIEPD